MIQGPGENAGVIDIGDGLACVFKMESHNHPSYIEPYQGAATGVGGILRDVFTMGARPIACLNALSLRRSRTIPKTRHLVSGVVAGIGGYGNSFGVPTVGGQVRFHTRYDGNILVNAMAVGLAETDKIFYAAASGVGMPIVYLGSKTGRDGIHGASMASAEFDEDAEEKRPTVQVGDPFSEKLLLEACLEIMAKGCVIAIQDMGAAGLTCSAVEMGAKGDLGVELDLDKVPCREDRHERLRDDAVGEPGAHAHGAQAREGSRGRGDLPQVGPRLRGRRPHHAEQALHRASHGGEVMADLPIKELGDEAPVYDRPLRRDAEAAGDRRRRACTPPMPIADALEKLIGSPDLCSKRWVWEQYDHVILGNTVQRPGGDAAVVRVDDGPKALALTADVTPRYCEADPFEGGKQAVAEAWRNITAVGGKPLAITDNLNFGNPEKPEIMGQFVGCVRGIAEACKALDFPVVSGNVSLYNETKGRGILPTPTSAASALLDDFTKSATLAFKARGRSDPADRRDAGLARPVALPARHLRPRGGRAAAGRSDRGARERRLRARADRAKGSSTAVHDLSDGGLLVALAEMAMASGIGATLDAAPEDTPAHAFWFGEDQARYLVTVPADRAEAVIKRVQDASVPVHRIGVDRRRRIAIPGERAIAVKALAERFEGWLPAYMAADGLTETIQGNSENATIRARLSADAMSKAVSSMVQSCRFGRPFPTPSCSLDANRPQNAKS